MVLRPDHPLTGHCVLSWADLADQELLWFPSSRNPNFSEGVLGHLAERGWTPRLRIVDGHNHALYCRHLRSSPNLVALRPQDTVGAEAGMAWRPLPPDAPHERFVLAAPADSPWAALLGTQPDRPEYRRPQRTTVRAIVAWPPTRIRCSTPSW